MKKTQGAILLFALLLGCVNPALAAPQEDSEWIPKNVEKQIQQRICAMRREGYTIGEISEMARYLVRVNREPISPYVSPGIANMVETTDNILTNALIIRTLKDVCP